MNDWIFGEFRFDPRRARLTRSGRDVALRPKTAGLLALLIEHRGKVVSKGTMAEALWPTVVVSEQSVFQTVSELRRALAPLEAIRTHPNHGYAWTAPLRRARRRGPLLVAAAAAAVALLGLFGSLQRAPVDVAAASLPPALAALNRGIAELDRGAPGKAEQYFALAMREHPGFAEAQLLLAEALLAQGRLGAARDHAGQLIEGGAGGDRYLVVAAMDIMSRSDLRAGASGPALGWLLDAADRARAEGFVCAAADLENRAVAMMSPLEGPPLAPTSRDDGTQVAVAAPPHCAQMRPDAPQPEARGGPESVSGNEGALACAPRRTAWQSNA